MSRRPIPCVAFVLGLACAWLPTQAHELTRDPIPDMPGLRVGAAVAAAWVDAGNASGQATVWPTARFPGWLGSGQTPVDRQGGGLEHAAVDAGLRVNARLGAEFTLGRHPQEAAHVEAARLAWRLGADAEDRSEWQLDLGRRLVPLGTVVEGAGHFDRFATVPLAKRLMLNDDWHDDGALLRWRREADADGLKVVDLGLWRARVHPGGQAGPAALTLRVGGALGEFDWDLGLARLAPRGRGAPAASTSAGHSHELPDCAASLVGLSCFSGRSLLAAAGFGWAPHGFDWRWQGAVLAQRERGRLQSVNGDVALRSLNLGGWLDTTWQIANRWQASLRLERVQTDHALHGLGATLVAADAGLSVNRPVRRAALALQWQPAAAWDLVAEAGQEHSAAPSLRWLALRALWRFDLGAATW